MLRSLSAAVSGLRNQQTRMDVIGNNVSNVNTVAFKAGRVTFKEGFAQLVESASRPVDGIGGTNPMEVGLGSQIGTHRHAVHAGQPRDDGPQHRPRDPGQLVLRGQEGQRDRSTRAPATSRSTPTARSSPATTAIAVQGRMATNGKLNDARDRHQDSGARRRRRRTPTTKVSISGNVDASAGVFDKGAAATLDPLDPAQRALPQNANSFKDMSITVYDSLGTKHELKMVMWKTGTNTWDWKFDKTGMDITSAGITEVAGTHPITFAVGRLGRHDGDAAPCRRSRSRRTAAPNDVDDQDRPRHGPQRSVAVRRLVDRGDARSGRLHERHAAGLQHRRDGHDRRRLHERHHADPRTDPAGGLQQSRRSRPRRRQRLHA